MRGVATISSLHGQSLRLWDFGEIGMHTLAATPASGSAPTPPHSPQPLALAVAYPSGGNLSP